MIIYTDAPRGLQLGHDRTQDLHQRAAGGGEEVHVAHFKRRRRKNARAGCLMCKPQKHQRAKGMAWAQTRQEKLARINEQEQRREPLGRDG